MIEELGVCIDANPGTHRTGWDVSFILGIIKALSLVLLTIEVSDNYDCIPHIEAEEGTANGAKCGENYSSVSTGSSSGGLCPK